jgi:L,D-peptidoglycan transpeptidase YkuD (ErfK/YbiS/YcfS/YnhG family)
MFPSKERGSRLTPLWAQQPSEAAAVTQLLVHQDDLVLTGRGLRFQGRYYPCVIGRGGRTRDKKEGDGATPVGMMQIVDMYYRPDRLQPPNGWAKPIRPGDLWSDDPERADYNLPVRFPYDGSHEVMRRGDPLYDLVCVMDWNYPDAKPGKGSCIFMHQWRRAGYPTAGCLALRRDHLFSIATQIDPGTRVIIPAS